ncbi:uncharacterized protein A4U43_C01F5550 [Asparagus officinalis]|uniref:non-specific serine/threonine protein kinase n=2 Tax=Asparagus officinalis TaxID=4686 RepID=A0A5P1FM97_ASPOF|nr:uncharacterized protein A4U43_C01F5550 [Asparagus officinalis]
MYVGFSASTEGSTEVHMIESWSFEIFGLPAVNLSSASRIPNNVSDESVTRIPAIPISNSTIHYHKNFSFGLVILGPVIFAVLLVLILWFLIKKTMLMKCDEEDKRMIPEFLTGPRKFGYRELSSATRGFHSSRIVGNGAFGTVYRAFDPKLGTEYAVKRSKQAHESKSEFSAELTIIAGLRHKNLVQLQGWCTDKNELLLVYEFMPNGSLDKILYPKPGSDPYLLFNWERRYNVAVGLASVVAYLHQECEQRVIHRDIKTSNIMLDSEFNPRLGDFGLARLMDHNMSPVSTLTAGTMGYLAPEYLQYGKYTEKTDVFSYGVVVLEVCCGRRPIDKEGEGKEAKLVNLVDWVWGLYSKDRILEAVDERLNGDSDKDQMLRLLLLGLSCVNPNSEERPSMRRVVQILNGEAELLVVPKVKPMLLLSSSSHLSLLEIFTDDDESANSSSMYEVRIDRGEVEC